MKLRHYRHPEDYGRVWTFLVETYDPARQPSNWLAPRWEYMFYLCVPMFGTTPADLSNIGIWEEDGKIVGVVHFEERFGEAYFQIRPGCGRIKPDMLAHAESHLAEMLPDGTHSLQAYINDWDEDLIAAARARGYVRVESFTLYMSRFDSRKLPANIPLPAGFALQSLAEDNDIAKLTRCVHRGFDHEGTPPEEKAETMRYLQTAPSYRKDLNIVVVAASGEFVSTCGIWYVSASGYAMVEPVATDPDYRRMGLAKAAVLEAIRRAAHLGAAIAYVATDKQFYLSIGFERMSGRHVWKKTF